jgi:hypothetical protein
LLFQRHRPAYSGGPVKASLKKRVPISFKGCRDGQDGNGAQGIGHEPIKEIHSRRLQKAGKKTGNGAVAKSPRKEFVGDNWPDGNNRMLENL